MCRKSTSFNVVTHSFDRSSLIKLRRPMKTIEFLTASKNFQDGTVTHLFVSMIQQTNKVKLASFSLVDRYRYVKCLIKNYFQAQKANDLTISEDIETIAYYIYEKLFTSTTSRSSASLRSATHGQPLPYMIYFSIYPLSRLDSATDKKKQLPRNMSIPNRKFTTFR